VQGESEEKVMYLPISIKINPTISAVFVGLNKNARSIGGSKYKNDGKKYVR